jgi:uncharacterized protein (TIGR03000 family)
MKLKRCTLALLAVSLAIAGWGASEAAAFGRRGGGPGVNYYSFPGPAGGGMGLPYATPGVYHNPIVPTYPYYTPYVAPYPAYGILPPPFATWNMLYGYDRNYGRATDDYTSEPLNYTPRKRPTAYPAVPVEKTPAPGPGTNVNDLRRVRFDITVPRADATVLVDGVETRQTGLNRVFVTPPMDEDRLYTSTFEVRWLENDKTKSSKHTFEFVAGEKFAYTFK